MKWCKKFLLCSLLVSFISCTRDSVNSNQDNVLVIPKGFPPIEFPEDNEFTLTRWELGKSLFYDKRLSRDSSTSCGSCHNPALAFSDSKTVSLGFDQRLGTRNSPTLTNVAYHPYFTRDGGVPTLEMQVLVPIQEHNEFNFNIIDIGKRLHSDHYYDSMSMIAYNRSFDYYSLVRGISTFERSLISGNSPVDDYRLKGNQGSLTNTEIAGMNLFFSNRTNCSSCHGGIHYTDFSFKNNGLYAQYKDEGRYRLTSDSSDLALFKVPTLRNVSVTGPYMHDGSIATLEEVIDHYAKGGHPHRNKSKLIAPLNLTNLEKRQLIAFLNALTDINFIINEKYKRE